MEIEVGEYVRTKRGYITQITEIDRYIWFNNKINKESGMPVYELSKVEFENLVTKHSKRIIDLIEKDDFVNGRKVQQVFIDPFTKKKRLLIEGTEVNWQGDMSSIYCEAEDIKTILTHEQFEQNAYRLEEK